MPNSAAGANPRPCRAAPTFLPFEPRCSKPSCVGLIAGASQMSREQLQGRRLTHYIANRLDDAEAAASASASSPSESQ